MKQSKVTEVSIENLGSIQNFTCDNFSNINVITGEMGVGKTFFLKALYTAVKTVEEYKRGDYIRSGNEILAEKLRWTYQTDKLGDLVTKGTTAPYKFAMKMTNGEIDYSFSRSATTKVVKYKNTINRSESNSIYIPPKEVFSLYNLILKSRDIDRIFGFDDTAYDLAKALRLESTRTTDFSTLDCRTKLQGLLEGSIELDEVSNRWVYQVGKQKYAIGTVSEGVKKIAQLDRLLANGYINKTSLIFIDELETSLQTKVIVEVIEVICAMAEAGVQFFITTNSSVVLNQLSLVAETKKVGLKTIVLQKK